VSRTLRKLFYCCVITEIALWAIQRIPVPNTRHEIQNQSLHYLVQISHSSYSKISRCLWVSPEIHIYIYIYIYIFRGEKESLQQQQSESLLSASWPEVLLLWCNIHRSRQKAAISAIYSRRSSEREFYIVGKSQEPVPPASICCRSSQYMCFIALLLPSGRSSRRGWGTGG
jgi:hypothetical protein